MFNRTTALILLVALAAGLGLMAGKKFFDRDTAGAAPAPSPSTRSRANCPTSAWASPTARA
jgi:hypothetical protein